MMLRDIAAALAASYTGDGGIEIAAVADPTQATGRAELALAMTPESTAALETCEARAVVVTAGSTAALDRFEAVITVEHPRLALAVLTRLFERPAELAPGVHPSAIVAPDAILGVDVQIGPLAVVGARTRIGRGTRVHPHATIGADVTIGCDGLIHAGARIADRVRIGDRVIIHENASIGADGFSFAMAPEGGETAGADGPLRIHSLGTVVLEDGVEVGANSAIDRATLTATRIGRNTKIDNLVQIGHNVQIGESCLICGMAGISGSVKIGDRVVIGGGVGIADHVTIGSDAMIAAGSGVASNVAAKARMAGYPAVLRERAFEQLRQVGRLRTLFAEVRELKQRLDDRDAGGTHPEGTPPEG